MGGPNLGGALINILISFAFVNNYFAPFWFPMRYILQTVPQLLRLRGIDRQSLNYTLDECFLIRSISPEVQN